MQQLQRKTKIIAEEDAKNSKKLKRRAETVAGVLESCAAAAATQMSQITGTLISPQKNNQMKVLDFLQRKLELSQVIVHSYSRCFVGTQ